MKKNKKEKAIEKEKIAKAPKNSFSQILAERKDLSENDNPKILVIGVGGGGSNSINAIALNKIQNITTIAYNTDAQALNKCRADIKMQIGLKLTKGHGAGANPEVGKLAAKESKNEISKHLEGAHVAFIVAGMGGGTGTGAAPEIAKLSMEKGILTIGLITTPFDFEGDTRKIIAESGVETLQENCDALIMLSNEQLKKMHDIEITFLNAFAIVDDVLCNSLKSFIRTITESTKINVDIADFFSIMKGKKTRAIIGTGIARGENKAIEAAKNAINNPLSIDDSRSKIDAAIVFVRCGHDTKLEEINITINYIKKSINQNAQIIFGVDVQDDLEGMIEVSIFATYIKVKEDIFCYLNENDLIGKPHSYSINEKLENEYTINKNKPSLFRKILNLFIEPKDEKDFK